MRSFCYKDMKYDLEVVVDCGSTGMIVVDRRRWPQGGETARAASSCLELLWMRSATEIKLLRHILALNTAAKRTIAQIVV
jgi:hypothetical protein